MSGIIFGGGATIDLTAPPTSIGTTTPVAVNSTIFTALPANNTSALVASGSSLTGSNAQSLVNLSQTWNTSGTPTAILLNIADTASNANSLFLDFQLSSVSRVRVSKAGNLTLANTGFSPNFFNMPIGFTGNPNITVGSVWIGFANNGVYFPTIGLSSAVGISPDLLLNRDAANTLGQRNGTTTQVSRLYKSFTDASNYTRSAWQFDANGVVIAGESAGTGDANISITLSPKGTGSIRTTGKIYPATDALAAQTAAGIFAGTGAPNNANGDNGDFYLRSDGGALTTVYQKRAGTWTGIV